MKSTEQRNSIEVWRTGETVENCALRFEQYTGLLRSLRSAAAIFAIVAYAAAWASADTRAFPNFNIPSLPLPHALLEFARQADVELFLSESAFSGLRSREVRGELPPSVALSQLLECTGFRGRLDDGFIRLERAPATTAGTRPSASGARACDQPDAPLLISELVVEGGDETREMRDQRANVGARA